MLSTGSSSTSASGSGSKSRTTTTESAEHVPGPEKSSTRLYVGNLHPSVDEYTLIQVFSKYGKIAKLDFLFHKTGPMKGKPRGYAFVEYALKEEALQALVATNDKMLRGRKVSVTFANKSEYADVALGGGQGGLGPHRHRHSDNKPTTLSLIKNAQQPKSTNAKIAAMEAKLKLLKEQRSQKQAGGAAGGGSGGEAASGDDRILPLPPASAGLPSKPASASASKPAHRSNPTR
ncbi:hypothetical protein A4X03_0g5710 [Tilletia caries]|uniref:Probable RNA-binding protein 18 n=1 Tax=Tilletia caries TaxID=13290 RepID=A0A177UUN4_9BASI|nr:hypothetical protein CF328_g5501 [Tilletia controversa]KAE8254472.1 hypothetical protein A4X03_0g5710 [Tilletia caries]